MTTPNTIEPNTEATSILERVAREIVIAYAWVSGPAMSQRQRLQRELEQAHRLELELGSPNIFH